MRIAVYVLIAVAFLFGGCAFERAKVANDSQNAMIGLTKEQVLACMGPPANQAAVGATEVWSYGSGNGETVSAVSGNKFGAAAVSSQRSLRTTARDAVPARRVDGAASSPSRARQPPKQLHTIPVGFD